MSVSLRIMGDGRDLISAIQYVHPILAAEVLSKSGFQTMLAERAALRSNSLANGKEMGIRKDRLGRIKDPESIANFIQFTNMMDWKGYKGTPKVVIGGKFKTVRWVKRENGVESIGGELKGVGYLSQILLEKLNSGIATEEYKKHFPKKDDDKKTYKYKAYGFAEKGLADVKPEIQSIMSKYTQMLGQRANEVYVKRKQAV